MVAAGHFDRSVVAQDPDRRALLLDMLDAGIDAADPTAAVRRAVDRSGTLIRVGSVEWDAAVGGRVVVLGLGKAAAAMARGIGPILEGIPSVGLVVAPQPAPAPWPVVIGAHPSPNASSLAAGRRLLALAAEAGPEDLVVALISGGGSALAEVPIEGVTMEDLAAAAAVMTAAGAPIADLNAVRMAVSRLKGGGLATAASRSGALVTLIVSDVVGNHPEVVASGPTVAMPNVIERARWAVDRAGVGNRLPAPVRRALAERSRPEPVEPRHTSVHVVADGGLAADAAARLARERGLPARVVTTELIGEAADAARRVVEETAAWSGASVYAGETTVTAPGPGVGGRNQELALAAGLELAGSPRIVVAACGTDGIDGPTDAAGGVADGTTVERLHRAGVDPHQALGRHDSHTALAAIGDLLRSGPTGTNVADLTIGLHLRS